MHWKQGEQVLDLVRAWRLHRQITRTEISIGAAYRLPFALHPMDTSYWTCSWADWVKIIDTDWLNRRGYVAEDFDCDDYSIAFKARMSERYGLNAVGLVIDHSSVSPGPDGVPVSTPHAYNVIFLPFGLYKVFEPQNDTVPEFGAGLYMGASGMMVL